MSVSLNKEELSLNKFVARDKFTTWIEQEILVPDIKPDVIKIIKVDAIPFVEDTEISDGTIKVSGKINYYILYRSMEGGALKGINVEYPFAQTINTSMAKSSMNLDMDVIARNVIYSLPNERKILLKTEVVFDYDITETVSVPVPVSIEEGENIEYKMGMDTFNNVLSIKKESIDVSEEVILPEDMQGLDEIIKVSSKIKNTDYKISYNKILVKGDLDIQFIYTKGTDMAGVGMYNFTVPFAGMIEFENIADTYMFDVKYTLQNLQIILSGTDNNVINVEGTVCVRAIMYEEKELSHIADFYSTDKELAYDFQDMAVIKNKTIVDKEINIRERVGQIDENSKLIDYSVDSNALSTSVSGGNLYIMGNLKIPVMYENTSTGIVDVKTFEVSVDNSIPLGKDVNESNVKVDIKVAKKDVTLSGSNVEANIILTVTAKIDNIDNLTVINEINESILDEDNFDSMYIYIVKKGDTLWDIAKKYKTTVAKIANVNNINDENKIDIGQKLLLIR